jgi:hypothetical protein
LSDIEKERVIAVLNRRFRRIQIPPRILPGRYLSF